MAFLAVSFGFAAASAAGAAPRLSRITRQQSVALVAVAAAIAAVASDAAATGSPVVDGAYRALLVGLTSYLGSRVGLLGLAVATTVATILSAAQGWAALWALAAAAAIVGWQMVGRRAGSGREGPAAVVTACCALSVIQPGISLPRGQSALAAGILLLGICALGFVQAPRPARRRMVLFTCGFVAFLGVAAGLGAIAVVEARHSLEDGVASATRGANQARRLDSHAAGTSMRAAAQAFDAARGRVRAPRGRVGMLVPLLGQHLGALEAASASGVELGRAGAELADAVDPNTLRIVDGRIPLERLQEAQPRAAEASAAIAAARRTLADQRSPWLLAQVTRRLDQVEGELATAGGQADLAAAVLGEIPPLLGSRGPRRYFVAVQTPSELRGSGGLMGSFAEIAVEDGRLTLARTGRTRELNADRSTPVRTLDAPADFVRRYAAFDVATTWQNVTISPHFPSDAQVIRSLYPQSGGRPVDAVLAIDPFAIQAILKVVGPIRVEGAPAPLTGSNAARTLLFDQYRAFADDEQDDRRDFLAGAIRALAERVLGGTVPLIPLAEALQPMVDQKHLMMSAGEADEEPLLARLGMNGAMAPVRGDSLAVIVQNAGASKIDWFLRRKVDYEATVDPDAGILAAKATIQLTNEAPANGLPRYLIGNSVGLPPGTSRMYVSVYSPLRLRGATVDGEPLVVDAGVEQGRLVYSAYVIAPPGATRTVTVDLEGTAPSTGLYRLDLHRQPSATADEVTVALAGPGGAGHRTRRSIQLTTDTVFRANAR